MITFIPWGGNFETYGPLSNGLWCHGEIPLGSKLGAHWTHKDTFQFATNYKTNGSSVVNIYEFQPTSTPPLCVLSSFPVPHQFGVFSFSPVSFHASFEVMGELIILDVRDSKLLLKTEKSYHCPQVPGQFSYNGEFFAYGMSEHEICVWQNTPTGYVPWSSLRPRLPFKKFLWSPTSISILCWGETGVQLLYPDNHLNPPSPDRFRPHTRYSNHLVVYSTDGTHIVTAQWLDGGIVTVLDRLFDTPHQSIHTNVQLQDTKVIDNATFVVDVQKVVGWDLKAGSIGVAVDGTTATGAVMEDLITPSNRSQLAFALGVKIFLYDVKTRKVVCGSMRDWCQDVQYSLGGHQSWSIGIYGSCFFMMLVDPLRVPKGGIGWRESLLKLSYGPNFLQCSTWIEDFRGRKLLWLPLVWRGTDWHELNGDGKFLASLHLPEPVVIEFQL